MADFDDARDPELGAACNRLAAFCEALPADVTVDAPSGLTEGDLVLILRRLHAMRLQADGEAGAMSSAPRPQSRPSVPITARK